MFRIEGNKHETIQQGDIGLIPVESKFEIATPEKRAILAFGEVTGHAHVIDHPRAKLTREKDILAALEKELVAAGIIEPNAGVVDAALLVEGDEAVALTHEEHEPHKIAPGRYAVLRQREYVAPEIQRRAAD